MKKQAHAVWRWLWAAEYGLAAVGAGTALMAIMLITMLSVMGRYVFHTDLIPGAYNMIERVLFPLMVFWALPLSHREGMFPKLESFVGGMVGNRSRAALAVVVGVVELVVYLVLMYFVWIFLDRAITSNRTVMIGVEKWPMWPVAIMMPLAFGLMMIEMTRLIWRDVQAVITGRPTEPDHLLSPPPDTL